MQAVMGILKQQILLFTSYANALALHSLTKGVYCTQLVCMFSSITDEDSNPKYDLSATWDCKHY